MHALHVIIARQEQAAGREAAHADQDWDDRKASAIIAGHLDADGKLSDDFKRGWREAQSDSVSLL